MAEAVNGDDINAALRASCAGFRAEMIIELSTQDGDKVLIAYHTHSVQRFNEHTRPASMRLRA